MDNATKLSNEQINSIMNEAKSNHLQGNVNTEEFIKKHLNEEQAAKVKSVLSDPEKLKKLLESPLAQNFMRSMREKQDEG